MTVIDGVFCLGRACDKQTRNAFQSKRLTGVRLRAVITLQTFVVPVLLHGSECRCLRKEDKRRILTAEMTWLRRLLRVTRRDKMRNVTVCGIICQETTLVDRIAERRLNWFGHVSRLGSERLPAKALHCYINGKRNQGRQPKNGWTM